MRLIRREVLWEDDQPSQSIPESVTGQWIIIKKKVVKISLVVRIRLAENNIKLDTNNI